MLTEQDDCLVCMHPDLSVLIQHAVSFSSSRSLLIWSKISLSFLIHGVNLAPKCIRSAYVRKIGRKYF